MANFKQTVITKAAHNLIAKSLSGSANINFTRVATSKYDYKSFSQSKLESLTSLEDIKQYVAVDKVEKIGEASVNVSVKITNANITEGYYVNTIGLFAIDPEEGEILYSVTVAETADYFPADNGVNCSGINLDLVTEVSNASNVNITVNYAGYATNEDIEKVNSQLNDIENDVQQLSNPNLLINGDFQVWQRGTHFENVGAGQYQADRWQVLTTDGNYLATVDKVVEGLKISQDTTGGAGCVIQYRFEDTDLKRIDGKVCTLSKSINGAIETTQITPTSNMIEIGVGSNVTVNWVKLELGDKATPFSPRPYAEELAMCQRYYLRYGSGKSYLHYFNYVWENAGLAVGNIYLPVTPRQMPTINSFGKFAINHGTYTENSLFVDANQSYGNCIHISFQGSGVVGQGGFFRTNNDLTSYIEFDSEIY